MEIICINFLNPNQGTYQVPTMKRGGSKILRTKSNKRVLNEPEPRAINIDGSKLKLARAELEIKTSMNLPGKFIYVIFQLIGIEQLAHLCFMPNKLAEMFSNPLSKT